MHQEATDAEEDQVEPLPQVGGQSEIYSWYCKECHGTDDRGPGREVIDRDEGMCALADPTDGGVRGSCTKDADEGDAHGTETLGRRYVIGFIEAGGNGGVG